MLRPVRLKIYIRYMQALGHAPDAVVAGTDLDVDRLDDPSYLVDADQCCRVIRNMLDLSGNPSLGLAVGQAIRITDFGIVSQALMASNSLGQAAKFAQQFNHLMGGLVRYTLLTSPRQKTWQAAFEPVYPLGDIYPFCVEESLLIVNRFSQAIGGVNTKVKQIELNYPDTGYAKQYRDIFQCPVYFDCDNTRITILHPGLDSPIPTQDPELNRLYRRHCLQVVRQLVQEDPVAPRVRAYLINHMEHTPGLRQIASHLGMSARTLRRRLQQENNSFQQILKQVRYDLAREYLAYDRLAVKEIAGQLGYQETNAFRRAFRSWSGMTTKEYRNQLLSSPK